MADTYSNRLLGRLSNLANLLDKNGYRNESSLIRTLIGRVGNWKDGYEWNEANSLSIGDADHVLEEVVKTFTNTINEIARKKLVEKSKTLETQTEAEKVDTKGLEQDVKELEATLDSLG